MNRPAFQRSSKFFLSNIIDQTHSRAHSVRVYVYMCVRDYCNLCVVNYNQRRSIRPFGMNVSQIKTNSIYLETVYSY